MSQVACLRDPNFLLSVQQEKLAWLHHDDVSRRGHNGQARSGKDF